MTALTLCVSAAQEKSGKSQLMSPESTRRWAKGSRNMEAHGLTDLALLEQRNQSLTIHIRGWVKGATATPTKSVEGREREKQETRTRRRKGRRERRKRGGREGCVGSLKVLAASFCCLTSLLEKKKKLLRGPLNWLSYRHRNSPRVLDAWMHRVRVTVGLGFV